MSIIDKSRKVHFVGIGGVGMSGLAEILCLSGHSVSGSDLNESETTEKLSSLGALIQKGHDDKILKSSKPDVVVYSTAVSKENPELVFARKNKIPLIRRAEMLAELMRLRRGIAVAGSHGKTTTTGLLSLILREAGLDPAVIIGGKFDAIGSNATWGEGQWLVAEADESDGSFNRLAPELAIVTNIDKEHLNHYGSFDATLRAFEEFLDRLPFYGKAVLCSDCPNVREVLKTLNKPFATYGFDASHKPDYWVELLEDSSKPSFKIHKKEYLDGKIQDVNSVLEIQLSVPGRHNVLNSSAAAILALELGVEEEAIAKALFGFSGVSRRFDRRGDWKCGVLIEDYAHHPTEIVATLQACAVSFSKKPYVIFQPHRFSRTRELWGEFGQCFKGAEKVFVLPIYAASEVREIWADDVDKQNFARHLKHVEAEYFEDFDRVIEAVRALPQEEQRPLLVLGAGNVSKVIEPLLVK